MGYVIIALALIIFVQTKQVYPELLLARLFFSVGGAATSTMVTAVLPAMSAPARNLLANDQTPSEPLGASEVFESNGHAQQPSVSSELTMTPALSQTHTSAYSAMDPKSNIKSTSNTRSASSKIAGYVGMCAGCGALLALLGFLPLPARFQKVGTSPAKALQYSYYVVAAVALLVAFVCFVGLSRLRVGHKLTQQSLNSSKHSDGSNASKFVTSVASSVKQLGTAFTLGIHNPEVALGYVGGFVARASSVGVSLFVPLLVNAAFTSSGQCPNDSSDIPGGLPDIKRRCPQAYVVAAELTGVSQLTALLCAPAFGYVSASIGTNSPLIFASVAGILGYPIFATQFRPTGHRGISFSSVCLIGISQIGAIVCSLATLSNGLLSQSAANERVGGNGRAHTSSNENTQGMENNGISDDEAAGLMTGKAPEHSLDLIDMKGSVAGMYSLYGGAGILLLTKCGGLLFDKVSYSAPFYIMAAFNGILLATCLGLNFLKLALSSRKQVT